MTLSGRNFLSTADFTRQELATLLELAALMKSGEYHKAPLAGKSVALVFLNPSLRTRTSLEVGIYQLGGHPVSLDVGKGTWTLEHRDNVVMDGDKTEHIKEAARVLSRYVSAIGVRAFPEMKNYVEEISDPVIRSFARYSSVPVFNLESSRHHPFQSMADIMTIKEKLGKTEGQRVVLSWAFHPKPLPMAVPNSFALIAAQFGTNLTIACPPEYEFGEQIMSEIRTGATASGASVQISHDFREACVGAQIVYAKSWGSKDFYGHPEQDIALRQSYRHWTIDKQVMDSTDKGWFMHCLPVRRNVVVTDEVLDGPQCAAIDEAENRLHVQKAILSSLISAEG